MVSLRKKKNEPPSVKEQVKEMTKGEIIKVQATQPIDPQRMLATTTLPEWCFHDPYIMMFFVEGYDSYDPLYAPLYPYVSWLNVANCITEREADRMMLEVDTQVTRLKALAKTRKQYITLNALKYLIFNRIYAAVEGFVLKNISEERRTLRMEEGGPKKKRWWKP